MASFGKASTRRLLTCSPELQEVLNEAIKHFDFSIIWGHRGKFHQNKAFADGYSTLQWPNSWHNSLPSDAVDIVPYPGGFKNKDKTFYKMATYMLSAASKCGVPLFWGGHWRSLKDLAHFQTIKGQMK